VDNADVRPEITKTCARDGCDNDVPGLERRPDKRFCSPRCRSLDNARRIRARAKATQTNEKES
jgi:endogenous inhibitor of DNA gyrase (YacG/DUF329 family)